jgi:hypothetical protein
MDRRQELSVNRQRSDEASSSRPLAPSSSRDVGGVRPDFAIHSDHPTASRAYNGITANDNSRFHAGDVYNYNSYLESATMESSADSAKAQLRNLRAALSYPQMGLRTAIVEDAYADTCQWLFNTPEYQRWRDPTLYSSHHGFLWIKGKPGTGKSTAMKTLLSRAESTRDPRGGIVLSYFFNARGEALERSIEGLYRSLVHQITADATSLPEDVIRWSNSDSLDLFNRNGWQVDLLKSLLKKIVLLDRQSHLWCFIDALDEGDNEQSVRDMVEFLEDLTEAARGQHLPFSVCLASRHYPNISVRHLEELQLDGHEGHLNDIDIYVRSKTKVFSTGVSDELIASIKHRSSGVFLWVVLVIAEMKRHVDHGNDHKLQALLESIPVGVERLLDDTLEKAGQDECLVATLQWALFSTRPLNLREFHTAVMLSNGELHAGAMHWDDAIAERSSRRFIVSASKGLLEIVASDRIQFIHESVREYFLRSGLNQIDHSLETNALGISHHRLAWRCRRYLQLTELTQALRSSADPFKHWRRAQKAFPLLQYAMDGMLRHADKAAGYGIQLRTFDEIFSFDDYLGVKSRTMGNFGEEKYHTSPPPTAFHIMIYEQCNHLAELALLEYQNGPPDEYRAHLVVDSSAHLVSEREKTEKSVTNRNSSGGGAGAICTNASRCVGGPLHIAARKGAVDIALALLKRGVSANDHCQTLGTPLLVALQHYDEGQPQMIKALLGHGADPNQKNEDQITPLQLLLDCHYTDALWILLEWGADVNATLPTCDMGCSLLILAVTMSRQYRPQDYYDTYLRHLISLSREKENHSAIKMSLRDKPSRKIFDSLEILLALGATVDARCQRCGDTAMDVAVEENNGNAQYILKRFGEVRQSVARP